MLIQRKSGKETVRFANVRRNGKTHHSQSVSGESGSEESELSDDEARQCNKKDQGTPLSLHKGLKPGRGTQKKAKEEPSP